MIYLTRASAEGVCFCSCAEALVVPPGVDQAECPWCGCGWLFDCILCRKPFTFAKALETDLTPQMVIDLDRLEVDRVYERPKTRDLAGRAIEHLVAQRARDVFESNHLRHLVVGEEYVYLDGLVLPAHPGRHVEIHAVGMYGTHHGELPHAVHRASPEAMRKALDRAYWGQAQALKHGVSSPNEGGSS